jgi:F420H(2)-dependent quinone reductase
MPLEGEYVPSRWSFAADHVERYESSGGTESTELQGAPVVILSSRGQRTGKIRKTPLMRVEHDGRYAVVGSRRRFPGRQTEEPSLGSQPPRQPGRDTPGRTRRA